MICTRCNGSGFLNIHQLPDGLLDQGIDAVFSWIESQNETDVTVCDCCGNGDKNWYGTPGEHYTEADPAGSCGPYAYNGGLCECD